MFASFHTSKMTWRYPVWGGLGGDTDESPKNCRVLSPAARFLRAFRYFCVDGTGLLPSHNRCPAVADVSPASANSTTSPFSHATSRRNCNRPATEFEYPPGG